MNRPVNRELNPPARILMGAGPSNVHPRVTRALTLPIIGFLDPQFIQIMDDMAGLLRQLFGSTDSFSLPISGTGSAGMEAGIANLLEPEDVILVASCGYFGDRMAEMAKRYGAEVIKVKGNYEKSLIECIKQSTENNWQIVQDVAWKDYMLVPKYTMAGYTVMMKEIIDQINQNKISHIILQAGVGGLDWRQCKEILAVSRWTTTPGGRRRGGCHHGM